MPMSVPLATTVRRVLPLPLLLGLAGTARAADAEAACPPAGWDRARLEASKADAFRVDDDARVPLAQGLLACLADPDPALRDGIAYEALAAWMRAGRFDPDTLRSLGDRLTAMLAGDDPHGVARPFAALVLGEVARTDRVAPWMSAAERDSMVASAAGYLASVRDYRGFEPGVGWRHGVAHGADWAMQLTLNPALDRTQLDRLLAAVAAQVAPPAHAYVFGEPQRLARPVLFAARRGLHSPDEWRDWLVARVRTLDDPERAWRDPAWLARRHDVLAFLQALQTEVSTAPAGSYDALAPGLREALAAMP